MKELAIIEQILPTIKINFDEVKEDLAMAVEKYSGMVVTDETLADCKQVNKELSKMRRTIDGARLDIKREVKKPLDIFEGQMKELLGIISDVENPIKKGIEVFTEAEKEKKRVEIRGIIAEEIEKNALRDKFAGQIEIAPRWSNKTASINSISAEVEAICGKLKSDQDAEDQAVSAIDNAVETANGFAGLATPIKSDMFIDRVVSGRFTLPDVLNQITNAAKAQKETEENAVKKAEEQKEEPPKAAEEKTVLAPSSKQEAVAEREPAVSVRSVTIKVTSTDEKLKELAGYMNANGISFEKINV